MDAKRIHDSTPGNYDLSLRVNDTFFNTAKMVQAGSYNLFQPSSACFNLFSKDFVGSRRIPTIWSMEI